MTNRTVDSAGEHPGGTDRPGQLLPGHDWLRDLITRFIGAAGLLQPDEPLVPGHRISVSEGLALLKLAEAAPRTQRDLAEDLGLEKSTVSRLVAGLEHRGLVTRERNPDNRRYYQLTLTEHGRLAVSRLTAAVHERHARILAAMTPVERDALATGLAAFLRALDRAPFR